LSIPESKDPELLLSFKYIDAAASVLASFGKEVLEAKGWGVCLGLTKVEASADEVDIEVEGRYAVTEGWVEGIIVRLTEDVWGAKVCSWFKPKDDKDDISMGGMSINVEGVLEAVVAGLTPFSLVDAVDETGGGDWNLEGRRTSLPLSLMIRQTLNG
jgi:hypothetical protein